MIKKNLSISNEELMKMDYKHTHLLKKFTNENGKIIPQRVKNSTLKNISSYLKIFE